MPRGRGRGRGRYKNQGRRKNSTENNETNANNDVSMEESATEEALTEDTPKESNRGVEKEVPKIKIENDGNEDSEGSKDEDTSKLNTSEGPKRRGRKRKAEIPKEDRYVPTVDPAKRGIMAQGGSLRRRDTLKSTWRYSPPPPPTRRGSNKFPSTNTSKYLMEDDDISKIEGTNNNKRKSLGIRTTSNSVVNTVENLEVTRTEDKLVVTLPDGSNIKVDTAVSLKKASLENETDSIGDLENDKEKQSKDPEYKPSFRVIRKKSSDSNLNNSVSETDKKLPFPTVKLTNQISSISSPSTVTRAQAVTTTSTTTASKSQYNSTMTKIPTILKPSLTSTSIASSIAKNPIRRSLPLTKYLDSLPEINDCVHNDGIDDSNMEKLPDKILLVNSELPLPLAVSVDKEDQNYLFRQIISPVNATRYVCLLCKGIDVNFGTKDENEILLHYQSLHELDVEIGQAKFSEDIVFICLPKMILNQFNSSSSLSLNSPCQYCNSRLSDINEMKEHYSVEHKKEVIMMEQEEIMRMHHFFYCCKCKLQSNDFDSHHMHMKLKHNLKTFRCKSCVLVTQDENRLRTHFKAKHMLHNSGQNYQCYYCHGLLIGVERLQKHIQQSHMVQTGPTEFSCVACRQSCGRGKELLNHAQNCSLAGIKPVKSENKFVPIFDDPTPLNPGEVLCYFCNVRLESEEIYKLHLHHEHKKWVTDAPTVTHEDGIVVNNFLTIDDAISDEDLTKAKIQTYVGHWCRMCDQMVKVYQLYYLHMTNYHKLEKEFQCVISQCKAQFKEFEEFKAHIEETGHSQKTIISHPDEVFVCTYCDIYFSTEEELINHLITDQHINKFTASGHFHRTEPRNFKCKACHTFFGMKESYIHHLETESHQYICTYCGITTATSSSRRAHIQNTHPDKLLLCEDCGESQHDILAHFVVHGYTFECKKCVKKFYNRERLNAHMEVHQDPIECTWVNCGRMIATRSMLVTHYRGHKSEHKCSICGQAFWNFAMLTSHLRSHQPMPRTPQSAMKANQINKTAISYSNAQRATPSVLQRTRVVSNPPILSNSVIKCGHCNSLFRSTKELGMHRCVSKVSTVNGEQNKLLELASKATAQAKAVTKPPPQRRRASPKKPAHQAVVEQQMVDISSFPAPSAEAQQNDEDTQLIMILNQSTGELMEITAPKGMEVQDVINSLNFSQSIEDVQVETVDEQSQQAVSQISEAKIQNREQDETAAAIEIIEQQANDVDHVVNETPVAEEVDASSVIIGDDKEQIAQIIEDQGGQEQAIVLPANCFNEDGSLTLDAATLSRLNLAISVDDNGTIAPDSNTTFIIDTSSIKE